MRKKMKINTRRPKQQIIINNYHSATRLTSTAC